MYVPWKINTIFAFFVYTVKNMAPLITSKRAVPVLYVKTFKKYLRVDSLTERHTNGTAPYRYFVYDLIK
jgi:hypothetical protein